MTSITEEPLRLFIFLPLPPSLVIYANEIVDREKEIEIITKRSSTNISTKILVSTTESSKQMSRILPNPNDRRGSPESRKCPRSIGDPTFQLSYKDLAKIDDDLSHNVCHCPMNLIPRFPQVSLYIYTHTYIWMFFPHGSLPRRAETYATPARNEAFTPPPRGEKKKFSSRFDPKKRNGYRFAILFQRGGNVNAVQFLPSPPSRSNLRAQVSEGRDR